MKSFHVCGLGNSLVDIFLDLGDDQFAPLNFERGTMRLVEKDEQKRLLDAFHSHDPRLVSGGSVALVVVDEAVLALTAYKLIDPLSLFYPQRGEDSADYHSRQLIRLVEVANLAQEAAQH